MITVLLLLLVCQLIFHVCNLFSFHVMGINSFRKEFSAASCIFMGSIQVFLSWVEKFQGGGAFNVIPNSVTIGGTFRAFFLKRVLINWSSTLKRWPCLKHPCSDAVLPWTSSPGTSLYFPQPATALSSLSVYLWMWPARWLKTMEHLNSG
jgi:hypothetical protein